MKSLRVNLGERSYDITIAPGLLDRTGEMVKAVCPRAKKLFVVTDSNVLPLYMAQVADSLKAAGFRVICHIVPAGEGSKCAEQLVVLWEKMMEVGLTRTDAVVALGGGVVGDLAGFAAATALRGVDFIQIPTTLLAQVDSSVGGKVAIDLQHGKNLAGCFWQPKAVLMDPETLDTLPDATFSDGMAEVIKYGCIADRDFFDFLSAHATRGKIMANIEHVLYICCDIKRKVVEADERDTGLRMILNFGHTVGHAYEKLGNYEKWTHGQAVAAGMCAAAQVGVGLGITPDGAVEPIMDLCAAFGLPVHISLGETDDEIDRSWETVVETIGLDKKNAGYHISLVLLDALGHAVTPKMTRDSVLENLAAIYGRA